jgi:hypothetical protein
LVPARSHQRSFAGTLIGSYLPLCFVSTVGSPSDASDRFT